MTQSSLLMMFLLMSLYPYFCTPVEGASGGFVGGSESLYIVKEVVELTSDWQDVVWEAGPEVHSVRYNILEGAEAVENIEVTGLTLWITQKSLDTVRVVVEVEALVVMGDATASFRIGKGAIGYTDVTLMAYDASVGDFVELTQYRAYGEQGEHSFDVTPLYGLPVGSMNLEEALPDIKGRVLAFYYPWYTSPLGPSTHYDHWEDVTEDSIYNSAHYPLHGAYDSNDENIIRSHMAMAKQAGIDAFIVSWWGIRSYEEKPLPAILSLADEMDMDVSLYYESVRELTKDDMVMELTYMFNSYASYPAFLRDSGTPVVFVYAVSAYGRGPDFWLEVRQGLEENVGDVVLIGDTSDAAFLGVFDGFHNYINLQENVEVLYGESIDRLEVGYSPLDDDDLFAAAYSGEVVTVAVKPFMVTVTPGFDCTSWGRFDPYVSREDGETYNRYWETALDLDPHAVLVTSWNEWHEGTEMEPSREHGFGYLTRTRAFVEAYKGAPTPTPEFSYTASFEDFEQTVDLKGSGEIWIDAVGATALYVNVTVVGGEGVTGLQLGGDFYIYQEKAGQGYASIIIPSVPDGGHTGVQVSFEADRIDPRFMVRVYARDPRGGHHILKQEEVGTVMRSVVTASASSTGIELGDAVTISGDLQPGRDGEEITLRYLKPDSTTLSRSVHTSADGSYEDTFEADMAGAWIVEASWEGDEGVIGATSAPVEVDVRKIPTSLSIQTSAASVKEGESVVVSGWLEPEVEGAKVSISYTGPEGSAVAREAITDGRGVYEDSYAAPRVGSWSVEASWGGDSRHLEAVSDEASFQIEEAEIAGEDDDTKKWEIPGFPTIGVLLGLTLGLAILKESLESTR